LILLSRTRYMASHEHALKLRACAIQFSSKVVKASLSLRIARKPTVHPVMKFSSICRGESYLKPKFTKKICKTDFELFLISHFLSLQKIWPTDFYFTLHEC